MGPGRSGGFSAAYGVVAVALVVAVTVLAMVAWGGMSRPLVAPHVEAATAAAASAQG